MMHRDLKLENIIFRNESYDSAVIIDFGYAQEIDESPYIIKQCGTPGFIAPEIFDENLGNYGP
jgi:serine/threonine protein kinase